MSDDLLKQASFANHPLPFNTHKVSVTKQELLDTAKNYKADTLQVHCQAALKAEVEAKAKGCLAHTSDPK
ncbi:hypothetical protein BGZ82_007035 [Podila clonocystis]|nr:hypothetical protein BGZ82_007035 [Podila clonocystis]